jgi:hypothetical protein
MISANSARTRTAKSREAASFLARAKIAPQTIEKAKAHGACQDAINWLEEQGNKEGRNWREGRNYLHLFHYNRSWVVWAFREGILPPKIREAMKVMWAADCAEIKNL